MTRLTRVELRRMLARRLPQLGTLAALAFVLLFLFGLTQQVISLDEQRAEAQRMYEENLRYWQESQQPEAVAECLRQQELEREAMDDPRIDFGCRMPAPRPEDFLFGPGDLEQAIEDGLSTLSFAALAATLVMGTTATAAEFAHRTMGTWLTFEPRRGRVWASKVLAAAVASLPVSVLLLLASLAGATAIYALNGLPATLTGAQWADVAWTSVRLVLLAALVGAVGAAGGILVRHTAALLGILIGYAIAFEMTLRSFLPGITEWLVGNNLIAALRGGFRWTTYHCTDGGMECREVAHAISLERGVLYVVVLAAVVLLASWWALRTRDID